MRKGQGELFVARENENATSALPLQRILRYATFALALVALGCR
jgi:hypothetical protein